jgi:hypothetical protein
MSDVTHAYFESLTPDIMNFQGGVTLDTIKESTVKNYKLSQLEAGSRRS